MDATAAARAEFEAGLERVRQSRLRSSGALCREAAACLDVLARGVQDTAALSEACREVAQARPAMGEMIRLGNDAALALEAGGVGGLREVVEGWSARREAANAALAEHALGLFPAGAKAVTLSNSAACAAVLIAASRAGRLRSAWCAASGPSGEGRLMARTLVERGIAVNLFSDLALEVAVREADIVWVGADALQTMGVVNKIGTGILGLLALQHSRPVMVASPSSKLLPPVLQRVFSMDYGETGEVLSGVEAQEITRQGQSSGGVVQVVNPHRERVDWDLITKVVSEEGVFEPAAITERIKRVAVAPGLGSPTGR